MSVCHANCLYVYSLSFYLSIVSLFGCTNICLAYIYPSIKSVCPYQSIHPVFLYSIHQYVCLYSICKSPSTQNYFPQFQNITSSGGSVLWTNHWGDSAPLLTCANARMHNCTYAPMHIFCQNHNFFFDLKIPQIFQQIFFFGFQPNFGPPVITSCTF